MDRQEFLNLYNRRLLRITADAKKEHYISGDYIANIYLGKEYKIAIDDCLSILNLRKEARNYAYNLKQGDIVNCFEYGIDSKAKILKINYKKGLNKRGDKVISSFTIKKTFENGNTCTGKITVVDLKYRNILLKKLNDCALHCSGYFLSFCEYDIKDIQEVLKSIEPINQEIKGA